MKPCGKAGKKSGGPQSPFVQYAGADPHVCPRLIRLQDKPSLASLYKKHWLVKNAPSDDGAHSTMQRPPGLNVITESPEQLQARCHEAFEADVAPLTLPEQEWMREQLYEWAQAYDRECAAASLVG